MATYCYRLPWPPSMNTYWRRGGNVTYLTKKAKEFRREVLAIINDANHPTIIVPPIRLAVSIELTLPDKRKRDIDNHIKAVLDAMEHAAVFDNDEQVDQLIVKRLHVEPPGCCDVTIVELNEPRD